MKNLPILLVLILILSSCGIQETQNISPPKRLTETKQPTLEKKCGDGTCNGPETAQNCPADCQQDDSSIPPTLSGDSPPLYFFYAIHTHGSDEFLPYTGPNMETLDSEVADNMIAAIEGIAEALEDYGARATWELLPAMVQGLVSYQGDDNVFTQLLSEGHEIGVHAHKVEDVEKAVQALEKYAGITPVTTSGFITQISHVGLIEAQSELSEVIADQVDLGLTAGTTNLTPGGNKNPLGDTCQDGLGVGNDMWVETGNLLFPWRPDYLHGDICSHNPNSSMLFISHVSIESLILPDADGPPDVLDARHFTQLKDQFDAAIQYMDTNQPDRVATWGFVTHIIEYAVGSNGEAPPDPSALTALRDFLAYVDSKQDQGLVIYATAAEIADLVTAQIP